MLDYMLAKEKVKDARREADKNNLITIAKRSRKIQNRPWLAKLARRFGLIQTRKSEDNSFSRQNLDIKNAGMGEQIDPNALSCPQSTEEKCQV